MLDKVMKKSSFILHLVVEVGHDLPLLKVDKEQLIDVREVLLLKHQDAKIELCRLMSQAIQVNKLMTSIYTL